MLIIMPKDGLIIRDHGYQAKIRSDFVENKDELRNRLKHVVYRLTQSKFAISTDNLNNLQLPTNLKDYLGDLISYSQNDPSLSLAPHYLEDILKLGVTDIEEILRVLEIVIHPPNQTISHQTIGNQINIFSNSDTGALPNNQGTLVFNSEANIGSIEQHFHLTSPNPAQQTDIDLLIAKLHQAHRLHFNSDPLFKNSLLFYVPLDGCDHHIPHHCPQESYKRYPLLEGKVMPFLDSPFPLMLLLGESGSGKSTFAKKLVHDMWTEHHNRPKDKFRIPLFIDLRSLEKDTPQSFITKLLSQKPYMLSEAEINTLSQLPTLLIFDGFDELRQKPFNLYLSNDFSSWDTKILITCRENFVAEMRNYRHFFSKRGNFECQEVHVAPFSFEQINEFIKKYETDILQFKSVLVDKSKEAVQFLSNNFPLIDAWGWAENLAPADLSNFINGAHRILEAGKAVENIESSLKQLIYQHKELREIVVSPIVLQMVVRAMPRIVQMRIKTPSGSHRDPRVMHVPLISRAIIYEAFFAAWFDRESQRLFDITGTTRIKLWDFNLLSHQKAFSAFCQSLSWKMLLSNVLEVEYEPDAPLILLGTIQIAEEEHSSLNDVEPWSRFFTDEDETIVDARRACPLQYINGRYSFDHRSYMEYFAALAIYEELLSEASLKLPFKSLTKLLERKTLKVNQFLLKDQPEVLAYLGQMIRGDTQKIERLLSVVKLSNAEFLGKQVCVAASNAMMILKSAFFNFSTLDFSNTCIRYADMVGAYCDQTNFYGADITGVNFTRAWLAGANLRATDAKDLELGEPPYVYQCIDSKAAIVDIVYLSEQNKVLAASGKEVFVIDTLRERVINKLAHHQHNISTLAISGDHETLVSGDCNGHLVFWELNSNLHREYQIDSVRITAIDLNSNGSYCAVGLSDNTVRIFQKDEGQLAVLRKHRDWVMDVSISSEGTTVLSGGADNNVFLWEWSTGSIRYSLQQTWRIRRVAIHPKSHLIASSDENIYLHDLQTDRTHVPLDYESPITALCFTSDGSHLICGSFTGSIRKWNVTTGEHWDWQTEKGLMGISLDQNNNEVAILNVDNSIRILKLDKTEEASVWWNQFWEWNDDERAKSNISSEAPSFPTGKDAKPPVQEAKTREEVFNGAKQTWLLEKGRATLIRSSIYPNNKLMLTKTNTQGAKNLSESNKRLISQQNGIVDDNNQITTLGPIAHK